VGLFLAGCVTQNETLSKYQVTDNGRVESRIQWAREHIRLGEYEQAKRPLKQGLKILPHSPELLNLLAFVFQQQGEKALAESYYVKALKSDSGYAPAQNNFGIFLLQEQRYSQACEHLQKAASEPLYERRTQSLENLGSCYLHSGQFDKAQETYTSVLKLVPESPTALLQLGGLAFEGREVSVAGQYFNRFAKMISLKRASHSAQSLWLGLRLSRENNDPSKAATYALLLKNMFPNSPEYQRYKESHQ
jgi:type IV pilus assembly protein PilF